MSPSPVVPLGHNAVRLFVSLIILLCWPVVAHRVGHGLQFRTVRPNALDRHNTLQQIGCHCASKSLPVARLFPNSWSAGAEGGLP